MCVEDWFNIMMINDVTEEFQNGGASFEVGSQAARWIERKNIGVAVGGINQTFVQWSGNKLFMAVI